MDIGAWDVGAAFVKLLGYVATLGAAGAALFAVYAPPANGSMHARTRPIIVLAVAALLLTGLRFPLLAGALGGLQSATDAAILQRTLFTVEGSAALWRGAGLILLCVAAGRRGLLVLGALLVAGSFAASGHVHARHSVALTLLLSLHALCAAFWIGALWPLERALEQAPARAAAVVARFSRLALAAVPALLLAGVVLLTQLLGTVNALWRSAYGRWLCVKLVLVCALLGLAALNRLRLTPRLETAAGRRLLRRSIRAEMVLAAGVLAVTAALTTFSGPGD